MDVKGLRKLQKDELLKKLNEERKSLTMLTYEKALGKLKDTSKISEAKKLVSRILTVINERKIIENG